MNWKMPAGALFAIYFCVIEANLISSRCQRLACREHMHLQRNIAKEVVFLILEHVPSFIDIIVI